LWTKAVITDYKPSVIDPEIAAGARSTLFDVVNFANEQLLAVHPRDELLQQYSNTV